MRSRPCRLPLAPPGPAVLVFATLSACRSAAPPRPPAPPAESGRPAPASVMLDGDELIFHVFDVGQGDCALVGCPNGSWVMIDCGSTGGGHVGRVTDEVQGLLDGAAVSTLVVTHPDRDHYNWLETVLAGVTVETELGIFSTYTNGDLTFTFDPDEGLSWFFSTGGC